MKCFKLWSVRFSLVYAILLALQIFPITGMFLMFGRAMAGPYVWGLIPHIITVGVIIDICTKKLPRIFWVMPVVLYGGYYAVFISQGIIISNTQRSLQESNPVQIIKYDPSLHSLVLNDGGNIGKYYKIPVSFEQNSNFPQGYLSYRMASEELCNAVRSAKFDIFEADTLYFHWNRSDKIFDSIMPKQCQISSAEKPEKEIIRIRADEGLLYNKEQKGPVYITSHQFYLNDKLMGTFKSARASKLPFFPFLVIGCALNSAAPSWECFTQFYGVSKTLNTFVDKEAIQDNPVAIMLGLKKYKEADFSNFQDYPENKILIDKLLQKKRNEGPEDFNRWGIRKDSLYIPKITKQGNVYSFKGVVDVGDKGGEFYDFITHHEGQIVYLDIDAKPNAGRYSFMNYGVCKARENCTHRTDDSYQFFDQNGLRYIFPAEGKFKGVFRVGKAEVVMDPRNPDDNDTVTKLIYLRPNP